MQGTSESKERRLRMTSRANPIDIKRLAADEGPRLRTIRLRALADAPDAFGSTYDEAAAPAAG